MFIKRGQAQEMISRSLALALTTMAYVNGN